MATKKRMRTIVNRKRVRSSPRRLRYAVDSPPNVEESPVPRAWRRIEVATAMAMTI
jgi:hypothetical protein